MEDPWHRLQMVYENCKVKQYVEGHYAKYDDGKLSMCGIGWALHSAGWTDSELKPSLSCFINTITNGKDPINAMDEYGFSHEERKKTRACPIPDCMYTAGLRRILEHVNEYHKIPIPNIGRLIPMIRNSTKMPTIADKTLGLVKDVSSILK
jgi:hypothetical protein